MPILYDKHNTGDISYSSFNDTRWNAQTFTVDETFVISSVKLLLYRDSVVAPGTITVSIRATSANVPTASDLIFGTTNGDTLTTDTGGEWREITFTTQRSLLAGVKYAIVIRCTQTGNDPYPANMRNSGDDYAGGSRCYSEDSGSSWTEWTAQDELFECWGAGDTILAPLDKGVTIRRLVCFASNKAYYET